MTNRTKTSAKKAASKPKRAKPAASKPAKQTAGRSAKRSDAESAVVYSDVRKALRAGILEHFSR